MELKKLTFVVHAVYLFKFTKLPNEEKWKKKKIHVCILNMKFQRVMKLTN